jgi:multidrug efflux pump subunit AcrA (membrane-fusion protein)
MRKALGRFLLPCLAAVMLVFAMVHVVRTQQTPPQPAPPVEPARTPFGKTVAGAGIVEARSENVAIGTALPGLVLEVYVPVVEEQAGAGSAGARCVRWAPGEPQALVGKSVKKGDPLFLVDDRALKALLRSGEANLATAQASLDRLEAMPRAEEVAPSEAKVRTAEMTCKLQEDLAERADRVLARNAISEEEARQRRLSAAVARRQLDQANAELALLKAGAWEPDKAIARAAVKQARARVLQTQTDLDRALVRAPLDGRVLQVNVRPGEYVGVPPGKALIVLGDTQNSVHVRVDIDEHDIPRYRPGAPARATPRGSPQTSYALEFVRVEPYVIPKKSLTGDSTERVDTRVLQAIYALDSTHLPIYVGQQLDVFIDLSESGLEPEGGR